MKKVLVILSTVGALVSCSKDKDPLFIVPPSSGSSMILDGGIGASNAENSVYVDFSADNQKSVQRNSWDLGFYCGPDFKVIINSTTAATAVAVDKTDINSVTAADFNADTLALGRGAGSFAVIDDPREANILNKTVVKEISANEAANKVYVINRVGGTGTTDEPEQLYKIRVLRNGQGYVLQYARLTETTFKEISITRNEDYNFVFVSFDKGTTVAVEPEKDNWDITWGLNTYMASPTIPYTFSDFVIINNLGGTTAFERVYASAETATDAYTKFNRDSAAKYTFSNNRLVIAGNWRTTAGPESVKKDRFYIVKDAEGNIYKLKFLAMGKDDGGERGRPQLSYELIK